MAGIFLFNTLFFLKRHCEERSNLYIGKSNMYEALYSIKIASYLAMKWRMEQPVNPL